MRQRKVIRTFAIGLLIVTLLMSLVACGDSTTTSKTTDGSVGEESSSGNQPSESTSDEKTGGHFNLGINADIGDIAPFGGVGTGRTYTKYTIYEYLLQFSEFGQTVETMIRQVAKDVEVIDSTTCRITIYDYVEDAEGNHITAEDVKFCYDTMLETKQLPKLNSYLSSVEINDEYTLTFTFTGSKVGTMEYCFCQVPIVSKTAYETSDNGMATKPVSTAPYQVAEMVSGSYLDLVKNENYWQTEESLKTYMAAQAFDTIRMNVITEAAQMTIALQGGTIDAATVVGGKELENFVDESGEAVPGFTAKRQIGGVAYAMMFNTSENSLFNNLMLRQAVCYAIDSGAILQGASNGAGDITKTAATVIAADYNKEWDSENYYDYDLDKAKQLLNDAGYSEDEITIRLMVENTAEYNKMAELIQAYLLQIGIKTEIMAYDSALFNTYRSEADQWDIRMNAIGTSDFVVGAYELAVGSIADKYLDDSELDNMLKIASDVSSHSNDTVEQLHEYIKNNAYAYGLYSQSTTSIAKDNINIVRHPWGQLIAGACSRN
jgi:ABC-type transport system substrate-binding protein